MIENKKCPMCGKTYSDYPAISRTMGKEEICPTCGAEQAMQAMIISQTPCYQTSAIATWANNEPNKLSFLHTCFQRHCHFDWGDMDDEDKRANDVGLVSGDRLFSAYVIPDTMQERFYDGKIWIITEWDRSATTILFPSDY